MRIKRWIVQLFASLAANPIVGNIFKGRIYQGNAKYICVPGLNCYSCPSAIGSCPIGALQSVIGDYKYKFSFYVTGLLVLFGTIAGKWICGWLCPFGWTQDLLHKIPSKKLKIAKKLKWLTHFKYVVLIVFVIALPLLAVNSFGLGDPWFCKYICPSGTIFAGIPLVTLNAGLQQSIGLLFFWKVSLAVVILVMSIFIYRFFCRFLCPLGAIYGLFNKISLLRMSVDQDKCIHCRKCEDVCKLDIYTSESPNCTSCIRCGDCRHVCPTSAIEQKFTIRK
ncbi:MAG: 4Fe-4S binding protein [Clostridiales bacterium]|nr:4Fe-4S binding protein [Clostridiales bacterium]